MNKTILIVEDEENIVNGFESGGDDYIQAVCGEGYIFC